MLRQLKAYKGNIAKHKKRFIRMSAAVFVFYDIPTLNSIL